MNEGRERTSEKHTAMEREREREGRGEETTLNDVETSTPPGRGKRDEVL